MFTEGHLKRGYCSGDSDMSGEDHNCLLLLIPGLSSGYISHFSVLPQERADVNYIETRQHFI
jgi:hypothetical protein